MCSGGGEIKSIALNEDGSLLAICMEIGWVYVFDIKLGEYTKTKFSIRHDQGTFFIFLNDHFG
jgi:hypothetical protein